MGIFDKQKKQPETVEVRGRQLKCPICSNNYFYKRETLLNSTITTLLNIDWADRNATCFVCSECMRISWFLGE